MNDFLTWLLDAVQSVDPVVRTLIAGLAIMLETSVLVGLVVPGDTVVIGAHLGESIGFWLGRFLGPKIRHSRLGRRIGEENWERSERYLRRRGGPAIFISRFRPVLHSLVPLTVGMSGYPYRRFLAWTVPACVIWATLYVSVGAAAAGTYRQLADQLHYAGYIFVGIIVVFLVLVFVSKKIIERAERKHLDHGHEQESVQPPAGGIAEDVED